MGVFLDPSARFGGKLSKTNLNRASFASKTDRATIARIPQHQPGSIEDLDDLLLASNASTSMTGTVLVVDGGLLVSSLRRRPRGGVSLAGPAGSLYRRVS